MCQPYPFIRAGPQGQLPGTVGCGDILLSHTGLCWLEFPQKYTLRQGCEAAPGAGWTSRNLAQGELLGGLLLGAAGAQSHHRAPGDGVENTSSLRLTYAVLGSLSTDSPGSCVEACGGGGHELPGLALPVCPVWSQRALMAREPAGIGRWKTRMGLRGLGLWGHRLGTDIGWTLSQVCVLCDTHACSCDPPRKHSY